MLQLEVNGINLPVDAKLQSWAELLEEIESKHLGNGKVIASVHFNGDEVAEYRASDILGRPLQSLNEVSIEAIPMEAMVRSAVTEAESYLGSLQAATSDIAETFRKQQPQEANAKLSELFKGIKLMIALLQGVELSLTGQYQTGSTLVEKEILEMGPTIENLVEAQTQNDWILVSDILEFELLANLSAFENTTAEFKRRVSS